ncbi:zinc-binding dehydrogenase, partial [Nocardioides sp. NPDC000441]
TVMAALERAGSLRGKRVLVVGAGMLGLTAVAAAADAGAAEVVVSDVDPARLELAVGFGATSTLSAGQALAPVDVAMDFSGAASAVEAALGALDIGGSLVLVGSVTPGRAVSVDPEAIVRGWRSVSGVHNYEPRHLEQAIAFLAASKRLWAELVEEPVGLGRVGDVLKSELGRPRASVRPRSN